MRAIRAMVASDESTASRGTSAEPSSEADPRPRKDARCSVPGLSAIASAVLHEAEHGINIVVAASSTASTLGPHAVLPLQLSPSFHFLGSERVEAFPCSVSRVSNSPWSKSAAADPTREDELSHWSAGRMSGRRFARHESLRA